MSDDAPDTTSTAEGRSAKGRLPAKRIMIYVVTIYLLWLAAGYTIQRSVLFPRSLVDVPKNFPETRGVERLTIDSPQGVVEACFIPGRGVHADAPGPLVIFAHGNGELIDHWPDFLAVYNDMGISVLLPEYRGYGRSAGNPSQKAIAEDFAAFYDLVTARPEIDADRVILHGRSIGGGIVAQLAEDRPSAAMILQSSPASVRRIAARFLLPWFLVRDPFNSVPVVRAYDNPVLVMHGRYDRIVSPRHGQRLADAADHPVSRLLLYDTDHNTVPPSASYWNDIEAFLEDAGVLE
jgi:alpha-beta hydrolase superfamily lysophospholipase